jgi:secreted trypsin-like serine protease
LSDDDTQIGIVSGGTSCDNPDDDRPGYYTRVADNVEWIQKISGASDSSSSSTSSNNNNNAAESSTQRPSTGPGGSSKPTTTKRPASGGFSFPIFG